MPLKSALKPAADDALATIIAVPALQGRVAPETFTHGTSEQRVRWFKRGMDSGNPKDCDTASTGSV